MIPVQLGNVNFGIENKLHSSSSILYTKHTPHSHKRKHKHNCWNTWLGVVQHTNTHHYSINDAFQTHSTDKRFGTFSVCHSFSACSFVVLWWVVIFFFFLLLFVAGCWLSVCNFIANKLCTQWGTSTTAHVCHKHNHWLHADYIVSWNTIKIIWFCVYASQRMPNSQRNSVRTYGTVQRCITISFFDCFALNVRSKQYVIVFLTLTAAHLLLLLFFLQTYKTL